MLVQGSFSFYNGYGNVSICSSFDVYVLLIFGVVLFSNVDGLVDLAAIDAFIQTNRTTISTAQGPSRAAETELLR